MDILGLPFPLPYLALAVASSRCRALQLPCLPVLHWTGAVLLPAAAVCRQGGSVQAGLCPGLPAPVAMGTSTASLLTPSYCGERIIPLPGPEEAESGMVGAAPPRAQPVSLWNHAWVSRGAPVAPSMGASPPAAGEAPDGAASCSLRPVQVPLIHFPHPARRHRRVLHTRHWVLILSSSPAAVLGLTGAGQCNPSFLGG